MAGEIKPKIIEDTVTEVIHVRVPVNELAAFKARCETHYDMQYYKMLRKLIRAFNDDRLAVKPTNAEKNLYENFKEKTDD